MADPERKIPAPEANPETRPFWEAATAGRLLVADGHGSLVHARIEKTLRRLASLPVEIGMSKPALEQRFDRLRGQRVGAGARRAVA